MAIEAMSMPETVNSDTVVFNIVSWPGVVEDGTVICPALTGAALAVLSPFGRGYPLIEQTFNGNRVSTPIEDAGMPLICWKTAFPLSALVEAITPVGLCDVPKPRLRPMFAVETPVWVASCCVSAAGRVETGGAHTPLGSIEIVARLLTTFPICTTTGTKHPEVPSGIVMRM